MRHFGINRDWTDEEAVSAINKVHLQETIDQHVPLTGRELCALVEAPDELDAYRTSAEGYVAAALFVALVIALIATGIWL